MCFVSYVTDVVKVLECHTHKVVKRGGNIYFLSFIFRPSLPPLYHILTSFLRNCDLTMASVYCS